MTRMNRRKFLGTAAGAAASFTILPRRALGGRGYQPPSETLNIAGIGVGGQGAYDLQSVESQEYRGAVRCGRETRRQDVREVSERAPLSGLSCHARKGKGH